MNTTHPSNKLYRGEVTSFPEAMKCYEQQMEYEADQCLKSFCGTEPDDFDVNASRLFEECAKKPDAAMAIYRRHVAAAERAAAAEMRATGDEILSDFADALESGDYSQLAV